MTREETLADREAVRLADIDSPEEMRQALLLLLREARATHLLENADILESEGVRRATGEVAGSPRILPLPGPLAVGEVISNGGETFYIASLRRPAAAEKGGAK